MSQSVFELAKGQRLTAEGDSFGALHQIRAGQRPAIHRL
jgi:hypothetical protein